MYKRLPVVNKALCKLNENIPANAIGIHGILYDVSKLNHPGGQVLINMSLGTDATSLFETHHLDIDKAKTIVKMLPILGSYKEYNKYDYLLYTAFKKTILKKFPTRRSRRMDTFQTLKMYMFIALTLLFHYLNIKNNNIYLFIPFCTFSSYLNAICGGYGHNAVHNVHPVSILLDWNGLSCYEWLFEHIQSHHMHVNTELDNDSISMEPFLIWLPTRKTKKGNYSNFLKHGVFLVSEVVVAFDGLFIHKARWSIFNDKRFPMWMRTAPFIFILRFLSHIFFSGIMGIITFFITLCLSSYLFSYLAHLNHTYESDSRPDFLIHQIKNTKNIKCIVNNEFILFLDRQVEHHLFPMLDHTVIEKNENNSYNCKELNKLLNKTIE